MQRDEKAIKEDELQVGEKERQEELWEESGRRIRAQVDDIKTK